MNTNASSHDNLFCYGQIRAAHASGSLALQGKLHIKEFVRHDILTTLKDALLSDRETLTTNPNTSKQTSLSSPSRQCLWELHSGIMLRLLENITGTRNLLPDTHCKQSRLLQRGDPVISNMQDTDAGLQASLVLLIMLNTGAAIIANASNSTADIATDANTLKIVYWTIPDEAT